MKDMEVYLQSKDKVSAVAGENILLRELVDIEAVKELKEKLERVEIMSYLGENPVLLVSAIEIIKKVKETESCAIVTYIGDKHIAVRVGLACAAKPNRLLVLLKVLAVCLVLFLGAGMAIMNFHADVNMGEVQRSIYKIITGQTEQHPLIMNIPYSLGIGVGMALFFNHFSRRKKNIEPSPLNVEMLSYEKGVYDYVIDKLKDGQRKD